MMDEAPKKEEKFTNVTHVKSPFGRHLVGVNLSEEVQALLRQKALAYGVSPQKIADQAWQEARTESDDDIRKYAESL